MAGGQLGYYALMNWAAAPYLFSSLSHCMIYNSSLENYRELEKYIRLGFTHILYQFNTNKPVLPTPMTRSSIIFSR